MGNHEERGMGNEKGEIRSQEPVDKRLTDKFSFLIPHYLLNNFLIE